jgi:hypothetical protein
MHCAHYQAVILKQMHVMDCTQIVRPVQPQPTLPECGTCQDVVLADAANMHWRDASHLSLLGATLSGHTTATCLALLLLSCAQPAH